MALGMGPQGLWSLGRSTAKRRRNGPHPTWAVRRIKFSPNSQGAYTCLVKQLSLVVLLPRSSYHSGGIQPWTELSLSLCRWFLLVNASGRSRSWSRPGLCGGALVMTSAESSYLLPRYAQHRTEPSTGELDNMVIQGLELVVPVMCSQESARPTLYAFS